jgi:signal transduction histidine kinase
VLTYKPETFFINKYSVTHVGFLIPIITTIFFVRPRAGIIAIIGTIAALSINCAAAGFGDRLLVFITLSILNLGSAGAIMMYVAGILIRHIKDLDALNNELEQRVADRTAQLAEANAFIERRATERAKQVAAVVHDLRHTTVAADSVLSLLELDVEDAEVTINEIAANTDNASDRTSIVCAIQALRILIKQISKSDHDIRIALEGQRGLLSDMLDMAQLEADAIILRPAAVDIGEMVKKVIGFLTPQAASKHCKIEFTADETIDAYCDGARLERVLHNIIGNAIKYTSAFRTDGSGQIQVEMTRQEEQVFCRVSDNGPGIAPDDLISLGQQFHRAERSTAGACGTGLGLHFCKGVLEASNGALHIESAGIGLGSCMTIVLPIPTA